jgi:hypothetical protein
MKRISIALPGAAKPRQSVYVDLREAISMEKRYFTSDFNNLS